MTTNLENIATEDLAIAKSSVAISSAYHDDEDDDHDPEDDDDDDGEDLGQVSLSSSSPLIALVSDTKVGRSATLASLIVKTLKTDKQTKMSATLASLIIVVTITKMSPV